MNSKNSEEMKITIKMMELFNMFSVVAIVRHPDGSTDLVPYWTNPVAEEQFNQLKQVLEQISNKRNTS